MADNAIEKQKRWTSAQRAAIDTRDRTLLVSAAAGSGKTATLTERIIRSLCDKESPSDISKMLIVTFTRAAANELKERIFKALSQELAKDPSNRHLTEQLIKLGSANICTIDAFYLNLIRQNFSTLGISASCRIADSSELDILKQAVMNDVIDNFYNTEGDFPSFAECFIGTRSIKKLYEPLLALNDDIASYPEGIDFLKITARWLYEDAEAHRDLLATPYGKIIRDYTEEAFEYYHSVFSDACDDSMTDPELVLKRLPSYEYDKTFAASVLEALRSEERNYDAVKGLFDSYAPKKMVALKKESETPQSLFFKEARSDINAKIKTWIEKAFSQTSDEICRSMTETARHVEMLYRVLFEYQQRINEEKSRRNILDFDDIRRHTLRLLVASDGTRTDIAKQYAEQFSDIYIDEYQDVDRVQDMIFCAISKQDNRFMVGDIKQSIYGFRGAEPKVFADYRKTFPSYDPEGVEAYPEGNAPVTIFMANNFRCDENIINFTNLVCSRIFGACTDSIGYTSDDDLKFSKRPPSDDYVSPKVEVSVILTENDDEDVSEDEDGAKKKKRKKKRSDSPTNLEIEAEFIAQQIEELISTQKKADGSNIIPGDIAVLYRSNEMVAYLSEALGRRGILCSEGGGDQYFESPDVLLVLCILNTVDNPHRDIYLGGTLCSPLFNFSLDDLILIRKSAPPSYSLYDALLEYAKEDDTPLAQKCRIFDITLTDLRRNAVSLPVDRFLRILFESDIFVASGLLADRNDYGEGGNLLRLYDYARTFEAGSFKGLYNFIEFINTLIENDKKLEVTPKERCDDRVTLTTMHHSKGLEFPVCFICGTAKKKNMIGLNKSLLYEYPTGVAMKLSDKTGLARISTPMRTAISKSKFILENEEEMRILYVALTRARERLYITASTNSSEYALMQKARSTVRYSCRHTLINCTSFLDWILLPFADDSVDTECCTLNFITSSKYVESIKDDGATCDTVSENEIEPDSELLSLLREKFDFKYGYSELTRIPAKLSVSRLSPDVLDESDTSADLFVGERKTQIPDFFITDKPSYASAAERGTATHLFFQFCDLERARAHGISEELARLVEKRFIPDNMAKLIYLDELDRFLTSELADRISNASKVIREQRFNLLLSADAFTKEQPFAEQLKDESLAVQGVIDLVLIDADGNIELYDYKTDRLTREELADDEAAAARMNALHGMQLSYYAQAVSLLFGKECSRVCVYSTHAAKLFDITPIPLKIAQIQ